MTTFDEKLATAWADLEAPDATGITEHRCSECDEIAAYFGGRPWLQFTNVEELRYHHDALALFSSAAFHYYLPAFMRATLQDPAGADVIPDSILFSLESELGNASRGRLVRFSRTQLDVVIEFLWILAQRGIDEEADILALVDRLEQRSIGTS